MKPFNTKNKLLIETDDDFNMVVEDMFTEFLKDLSKKDWATRPIEDDDSCDNGIEYVYTTRAMRLIDRYKSRMCKVGNAHFPDGDIECESYMYVEF